MKASLVKTLIAFSLVLLSVAVPLVAQSDGTLPKLIGIAKIADRPCVVLEIPLSIGVSSPTVILHAGEREATVAVKSINVSEGSAELVYHGSNVLVRMSAPSLNPVAGNQLNLTNAPLSAVLRLYSELTGRTLLEHPGLRRTNLVITADSEDRATLATILSAALTNVGIVSIPDGEKFLRILPASVAEQIQTQLQIHYRTTNELASAAGTFPAGTVHFVGAKGAQVASIYAELIGKKFDYSLPTPHMQDVVFMSHQPLTRAEIIYALDVCFAWRGMKVVPSDAKLVRLARLSDP